MDMMSSAAALRTYHEMSLCSQWIAIYFTGLDCTKVQCPVLSRCEETRFERRWIEHNRPEEGRGKEMKKEEEKKKGWGGGTINVWGHVCMVSEAGNRFTIRSYTRGDDMIGEKQERHVKLQETICKNEDVTANATCTRRWGDSIGGNAFS